MKKALNKKIYEEMDNFIQEGKDLREEYRLWEEDFHICVKISNFILREEFLGKEMKFLLKEDRVLSIMIAYYYEFPKLSMRELFKVYIKGRI